MNTEQLGDVMFVKAWMYVDEFVCEHKEQIWVAVYIVILLFCLWVGFSAPLILGPSTES